MRDDTYGISIIGFAAGLYGLVTWLGFAHATAVGPSLAKYLPGVSTQENAEVVASR